MLDCGKWWWGLAARACPFKPITSDQARLGIQCAVAIAVGCLFCVIDPLWTGLLNTGVWVLVSVLVVLEPNVGSSLRKSWLRVLGTALGGFGSLAMLEIAYAAGGGKDWENNSVPMAATITVLQSLVGSLLLVWKVQHPASSYAYLVTSFTLPIIWVPGLRATDGSDFTNAMRRLVSIIIGIAIPCIVQLLVFPVFARRQLTERLAAALGESVCLLRDAAASAVHLPKSASSKGGAGGEGAGIGSQAARLQRAQRKVASGMDKLLDPTATELRFIGGPLSAAAYGSLVDAVAVVGSTAVSLSAVLEAAHTDMPGTGRHPLPAELEGQLDAAATALASAFAELAAGILGTLEGCCLQRHYWEDPLLCGCSASAAPSKVQASQAALAPAAGAAAGASAALEAAAAQLQQLAAVHEAARPALAPSESHLSMVAMGACLVLLQQARAVAAVLQAAVPLAADQAEIVQKVVV